MPGDVKGYLSKKKSEAIEEEVARQWSEVEDLYTKRLWHQLTLKVQGFIQHSCFKSDGRLEMYESFISDFEHKINPLSLVNIAVVVSEEIQHPAEAVAFIKKFKEKVKNDPEATIFCMTALGTTLLQQNTLEDVKTVVEEAGQLLESLDGVTAVHAQFYDLSSSFHKAKSDYEAFYRDSLRYLGCVNMATMPVSEQCDKAFHLGLAALLAEKVYNFGELLSHSVLDSLRGTQSTWLVKLLHAFNAGALDQFEALRPFWEQQPDLLRNQDILLRKIQLLSLMELIFRRHAHDRTISFAAIASGAQIDINEVEQLVMKALSLGLVKGSIDQVMQHVTMTWVQPRVLDKDQVE